MNRRTLGHIMAAGLLALGMGYSSANPTGGQVAAGAASINTVPGTVTVNQLSNIAIINWQTFSIGTGELTKFVQPSSTSAALNRVLGGQTSLINGTLSANGQIYLINGNGIIIGPGGVVNANSFTASTRDITDSDFLSGNLHFTGSSASGVQNMGTINALGGDVYLIGETVDNQGTINAANGIAGLVAADDVLLAQKNADGSTITVSPGSQAAGAGGQTGVSNSGTISAMSAELKAANGNLYALAINNSGVIRATTVKHQGGHIYLTSDSGTVVNSGTLDASAAVAGGRGGSVLLKNAAGTTIDSGKILAKGGQGGAGGNVEVSGKVVQYTGTVDTTAAGGTTGTFLIDPEGTYTIAPTGGDETGAQVSDDLAENNVTINADNAVVIDNSISWTTTNSLTLSTNNSGSTITINASITGTSGQLVIQAADASSLVTTGTNGTIQVAGFILQSGQWIQNNAALPSFLSCGDFEINGGSFLRVSGGTGSVADPYIITDVYGLQGIASLPLNNSYALGNNIVAGATAAWNPNQVEDEDEVAPPAGFMPIGEESPFTGSFDGRGYVIDGLSINRPDLLDVGLFASTSGAVITHVGLTDVQVTGDERVGALVGDNADDSLVDSSYSSGTVSGSSWVGGLVGFNETDALVNNSQSSATVTSDFVAGGLVGENYYGAVQFSSSSGSASGPSFAGGLVGGNYGTISNSFSTASVDSPFGKAGGLSATIEDGSITDSYSTGPVTGLSPGGLVGGLINGPAIDSFWDEQTSNITTPNGAGTPEPTAFFEDPSNFPTSWNFFSVWQAPSGENSFPTLSNNPVLISPALPPGTPSDAILAALDAFDAYTANGSPPLVNVNFSSPGPGNGQVSVDNPDGEGGAVNSGSGSGKKRTNIASGSSTSGAPAPNRLLTPGSGINSIFQGSVNPVKPSTLVLQKFEQILNNDSESELNNAVFGTH